MEPCNNHYMLRKKLEPKIDRLLGEELRKPTFLQGILDAYNDKKTPARGPVDFTTLDGKLEILKEKRQRILSAFFEGVIDRLERDTRLAEVDRENSIYQGILNAPADSPDPISIHDIQACIEPLGEWEYLERHDKRALLTSICPQISVFHYRINSITLDLAMSSTSRYENGHPKTAR
jgi:hypothetical protein